MLISRNLHNKSSEVSIKTRSTPASLSINGQATKHTTVEWSIGWVWEMYVCLMWCKALQCYYASLKYLCSLNDPANGRTLWWEFINHSGPHFSDSPLNGIQDYISLFQALGYTYLYITIPPRGCSGSVQLSGIDRIPVKAPLAAAKRS